jgi:hypothetical protein
MLKAFSGNPALSLTLLLVAACASASLIFACATPFVAFAVIAAALLPLRQALATTLVVWLANQAIGFGILAYPRTFDAALAGLFILGAMVAATIVAERTFHALASLGRLASYPLALIAAFAVFEVLLFAVSPLTGGAETFALDIVGQIAFTNAVWLAGLVAIVEVARTVGAAQWSATR